MEWAPVIVGTAAAERLDASTLISLLQFEEPIHFVVNVPRESYIAGDAIALSERKSVPVGSLGDLMRAVSLPDVRKYVDKETEFITRGLRQHTRISDYHRSADRAYEISRHELPKISVVFLNEYEMTADHVRTARDRYGPFRLLVITNPNGRATTSAEGVAGSLGIEIHRWRSFLGRLNR
jgi:hypothetical protein